MQLHHGGPACLLCPSAKTVLSPMPAKASVHGIANEKLDIFLRVPRYRNGFPVCFGAILDFVN